MEKEDILKILQEDIHSVIVATLDDEGRPQTRAIDIMLIEERETDLFDGAWKSLL